MKALIQRVNNGKVTVEQQVVGEIDHGYLIYLGVAGDDSKEKADKLLDKILKFRINPDEQGKMNLNIKDAGGKLLIVSQFTLVADTSRGNRPSFSGANPTLAQELYDYFVQQARQHLEVATGSFGAEMIVSSDNLGPTTFMLEI